ncbi:MAG: hypothetical protein HC838_08265 [Spirulinaceae cyanobacterium RM2_2_10]|nr:hypothetical protein [Spirulinaceae cyanobacterium SM2_1_0]NJO20041.1 hypothetical protein [Spirulinaceae cyanobacterium RM2_2_10]
MALYASGLSRRDISAFYPIVGKNLARPLCQRWLDKIVRELGEIRG